MAEKNPGEPYTRITCEEAIKKIENEECHVIDVRNLDEYQSGHIPNSLFIPVDQLLNNMEKIPENGELLFICAAGARSGLACEFAAAVSIDESRLFNIFEGVPTWISKNLPTAYGEE